MSTEMETAGLASVGGLSPGGRADLSGQPCLNCGEPVEQRHCPRCGQLAASYHRPFYALVAESIADSVALDGRLARTLPLLLFRPGVLTRRYTSGHRARFVPPFRLFLLSSLLFYLVAFAFLDEPNWLESVNLGVDGVEMTDEEREELRQAFVGADGEVDEERFRDFLRGQEFLQDLRDGGETGVVPPEQGDDTGERPESDVDEPPPAGVAPDQTEARDEADPDAPPSYAVEGDVSERFERIMENPRLFISAVESWLPRLSLLLVPLTLVALTLTYFWRRSYYVYDHAIHALHLHSWIYLMATFSIGFGWVVDPSLAIVVFLLALPVYVFFSLRATYGSGIISSAFRTLFMGFFWLFSMIGLLAGVLIISALEM